MRYMANVTIVTVVRKQTIKKHSKNILLRKKTVG